jgi:hypothetical protein
LTKDEISQTLPGAGKKFTITGELKPFGKDDDGGFIDSRTWKNEIQIKVTIKRPSTTFDDYFWSAERVAVSLNPYVGKNITLDLVADQVKDEKPQDDKYWNYFCQAVGRHEANAQGVQPAPDAEIPAQPPEPTEPAIPGFHPLLFPECEGVVQGAMEKLAMTWFTASFTPIELRQIPHNIALETIRLMRDELFHDLKSLSIAPPHYCYDHEKSRGKSRKSGAWGHPMTDGAWCIEGEGTPLIPAPDLSPDAFLARMEEPEQPPPLESQQVETLFDEGGPDDSF